jgi:hypothetical protein
MTKYFGRKANTAAAIRPGQELSVQEMDQVSGGDAMELPPLNRTLGWLRMALDELTR